MDAQEGLPPSPRAFLDPGPTEGENDDLRVTTRLVDHATGEQVWGDEYQTAPRPGRWSGPLDDIGRVHRRQGGARTKASSSSVWPPRRRKEKPAAVTPYGAMLLSYEFFLTRDPQRLSAALEALHHAVKAEPGRGSVWTRLARVCFANHAFEVTSIPTPIEHAIAYGHHGVRLDPTSRIRPLHTGGGPAGQGRADLGPRRAGAGPPAEP